MSANDPIHRRSEDLAAQKTSLRATAQTRRAALHSSLSGTAPDQLCGHQLPFIAIDEPLTVSGFFPIRSEIDVRPLLAKLAGQGHSTALPVVSGREHPLTFRQWKAGDGLAEGWGGIGEPLENAKIVAPDILFVPLLLVDKSGYRLGYGAGHYDRTIAGLRRQKSVVAVGVCYAGQHTGEMPREPHDVALDWLLTEEGLTRFQPQGRSPI